MGRIASLSLTADSVPGGGPALHTPVNHMQSSLNLDSLIKTEFTVEHQMSQIWHIWMNESKVHGPGAHLHLFA